MRILRRLPRRRSHLLMLQAALGAIIIGFAAAMLCDAHESVREAASQQALNIANTMQRDLERNVALVDLALRNAQTAVPALGASGVSTEAQRSILFSGLQADALAGEMLVTDAHGRAIFDSSSPIPRQRPNNVERNWFKAHRDNPDAGLVMSLISQNAFDGKPVVVLSRRINNPDGTFWGTVGASLNVTSFEDLFGSLKLAANDNVYVIANDGRLVFSRTSGVALFGADYSASTVFHDIRTGVGPVFVASSVLGEERLYAQRHLRNIPLTVIVGLSIRDVYRSWWIETEAVGGVVAVLLVAALWLSTRLHRELLRSAAAETEARQSEARYRMLADSTTDVITCLDLQFRRIYVSPACRVVFGYEPDDMVGAALAATIHPQDIADTTGRFQRLATGEAEAERVTNRFQHKRGHYVWVEANLALVRDPLTGEPASIVCSIRDISLRKAQSDQLLGINQELERLTEDLGQARDAAERANRAKSRFLASISHELRTPLNGILGYAELLRIEGGLSTRQGLRVDAMLSGGMHLLELINCVLDLTEMEMGHVELRAGAADMRALAAACLDFVRPGAAAKGLLLNVHIAPAVPKHVLLDATRLRQILLNLLGNAVKFTQAGSVTLDVAMDDPTTLRFHVADTGPGIPAGQRELLFKDFQRLAPEGIEHIEGAGLGLALSARLAALMTGTIGHEDNPAGGSIFYLTLPAVPAEQDETPSPALRAAGPVQAPARILLVDDVAVNRDIAASFLQAAGHRVVCAEGGEEAVALAAELTFDVILMDVRMPRMDGLEASRQIRALGGTRGAVPIVGVTAQAFTQHIEECRQAGMDHHLAKPFTQAALLASVAKAQSCEASDMRSATATQALQASNLSEGTAVFGADLPIMDQVVFDDTSGHLSGEKVARSIRALINRTSTLLQSLRATPIDEEAVAIAAHSLAGSAGMFGFRRLAAVGQKLEHVVDHQPDQVPSAVENLTAVAAMSLERMQALDVMETQT